MSSSTPRPQYCENPDCGKRLHQEPLGRPRKYCDEACGKAARSALGSTRPVSTSSAEEEHRRQLRQIAEDLVRNATAIRDQLQHEDLSPSEWVRLLHRIREVGEDHEDLSTAMVQVTRDRGIPLARLAECWEVTPSRVSRVWPASRFPGRMQRRAERKRQRAHRFTSRPTTPTTGAPDSADRSGSPGPPEIPPPRPDQAASLRRSSAEGAKAEPEAQFSSALSFLMRDADNTAAALARKAGVSRSYVSRILAGDRFPSWQVTKSLVQACGGSTEDIRPLWAAAHDSIYSSPRRVLDGTLHTVLRGLYLAASRPTTDAIRATRPALAPADITGLLEGLTVPDWRTVENLVVALRGQPDLIRPLWEDATTAHHRSSHSPSPPTSPLPAAAFG
ncbi:helix-turn-helix transcriptional regulator [Streptomyces sp. 891-h]|uniref:helix-turn-helix domain-containing protein n=1 Tax=Streptomyces sp. 891-h TaxID=2720714 RepID=UPI001FAADDF0|nr:helix-turn-helix transcriptional regulator [Streptomyces sp. 891-h]UNZ21375.1 helix-turn-helix domain-containing protein [Streptomyces sp. 891-h]